MAGVQAHIRTFIAPTKGPGKTAPSFADDLVLYDPLHPPPSQINVLRDPGLTDAGIPELAQLLPADTCRHAFCIKDRQSDLPALDARPQQDSVWRVAVICRHCRLHVQVRVDYTVQWEPNPCPNAQNPLHHLVHSPWRESLARAEWDRNNPGNQAEIYTFECSSSSCSATVFVQLTPPVLGVEAIRTLTDEALLKARITEAFTGKYSVYLEGVAHPKPINVLIDLRQYIKDVWDRERKPIGFTNKRFLVRFGPKGLACKDVLENIGFKCEPEVWWPPERDPDDSAPFQSSRNIRLDDVMNELSVLILQRHHTERREVHDSTSMLDASRDIERVLSCQDYDKDPASRTMQSTRAPCYVALGVPPDASDEIVIFAYKRQIATKADHTPWFLSYLQQISNIRHSERLMTELAIQSSEGKFDADQLGDAYKYFGLAIDGIADDDHIIGTFKARIQDAPRQDSEMREQLRMIGVHRNSRKIIEISQDTLNTYEQALAFLNADPTTSDEFIPTLYTSKTSEDASSTEKALKAVQMVAKHRDSKSLYQWLETGQMGEIEMDIGEAYSHLNIENRMVDDEMIMSAYDVAIAENPGTIDTYSKAIRAIAKSRNSPYLQQRIGGDPLPSEVASAEKPVGLENIGNTCYLNSLLQFFFTISSLRSIVLDFDKYKMELTPENLKSKKVGGRAAEPREVQTAQKFVASLANLFREMINSPDPSITPKQELARLTLVSAQAEKKISEIRRRSTIASGGRPSLGHIDSLPVLGPLGPPPAGTNGFLGEEAVQSPVDVPKLNPFADPVATPNQSVNTSDGKNPEPSEDVEMVEVNDNSSEATLVSEVSKEDTNGGSSAVRRQQQDILDNKENFSPVKEAEEIKRSASPDKEMQPLAQVSDSTLNAQAGALISQNPQAEGSKEFPEKQTMEVPKKPPPVPPRPQNVNVMPIVEEYARQQDVTEVIANCLFQFSLAIRPLGHDKKGEQLDEIHNLFYGEKVIHVVPRDPARDQYELFPSILTRVSLKPHDIYAALDGSFDIDDVAGSKRFESILKLPPIFAVQLDRVGFDPETKSYRKLNHHVELMETIFLDRYLEDSEESTLMKRRKQTWGLKKDLARVSERKADLEENVSHPNAATVLDDARIIMQTLQTSFPNDEGDEELEVLPETIDTLETLATQAKRELDELSVESHDLIQKISSNFTDMRKYGYRLHAAFFHRGTAGYGHYWVYLYDFKKEMWRKYNDDYVTDITDTKEIFARPSEADMKTYTGPANPYFLVYVREDSTEELIDCVHREIIERPPAQSQMTEMPPSGPGDDVEMFDQRHSEQSISKMPDYDPNFSVMKYGPWDSTESAYKPSSGHW